MFCAAALVIAALAPLESSVASETITYTYDARGRLVAVSHGSTGPNAGISASYSYDKGDNRTNVTVATPATACSGVSFSVNNPSATEGSNLTFTVTKAGSSATTCSVNYATANKEAVAGSDYVAKSGTLSFSSAVTSLTVAVATTQDSLVEGNEGLYLNLSSPAGGSTISDNQGLGVIVDNDDPPPCTGVSFAVDNVSVTEGGNLGFTVTKTGSTSSSCSVSYATANGTAAAGSDYTAKSGTLTFSSTQTSLAVSVATINDTTVESAETVLLNLSNATGGATIADSQGIGTINDNDTNPCAGVSFAVNNVSVTEGGNLGFTVTKSGSTSSSCSVNYATANGTAAAGSDYTAKSGTLTFSSTQTLLAVSVATINDTTIESAETVLLNLSNATGGATIADSQGVGTINDNDTPACSGVGFAASDAGPVFEGDILVFTISKSGSTSSSCSVSYQAQTSSAGTNDFVATSGTLTFTATQTSKTVSVQTNDDFLYESTEQMLLSLSNPSAGASVTRLGTGTIYDNDSGGGGGGGCSPLCQTPLQSPEATDSTVTTQPAPDPTEPPRPPGDR